MSQRVGIVINFGPELRPLVLSGLIEEVLRRGGIPVVISRFPIMHENLYQLEGSESLVFQRAPNRKITALHGKLTEYMSHVWAARQRNWGPGNFHWSVGGSFKKYPSDFWLGSGLVFVCLDRIIRVLNWFRSDLSESDQLIHSANLDVLIYSGFADPMITRLLLSAKRARVKLVYVLNNWKDVYTDHYHQIIPDVAAYWSKFLLKDALGQNPALYHSKSLVSGNPAFYRFINYSPTKSREALLRKYKVEGRKELILWAGAQTSMLPDEHLLVRQLVEFLKLKKHAFTIFMRLNPFGIKEEQVQFYKQIPEVVLCDNYWHADRQYDITYQTDVGESEWADLLYHCGLIITVPSTVVLEAAFFDKMVVNFTFNSQNVEEPKTSSFFKTPFYQSLLSEPGLHVVNSFGEMAGFLEFWLEHRPKAGIIRLPAIIEGNEEYTIEKFCQETLDHNYED